jgi:hypothetical protein
MTESGSMTFAHSTSLFFWFKLGHCINSEDDAHVYEPCTDRLYKLICDEEGQNLRQWWNTFWVWICPKYPNVAVNHISQFLEEIIDRKEISLISLLPVSMMFILIRKTLTDSNDFVYFVADIRQMSRTVSCSSR